MAEGSGSASGASWVSRGPEAGTASEVLGRHGQPFQINHANY